MARMTLKMIEMYCDMIREQFDPLIAKMKAREMTLRDRVEIEVKKELGVYDMYVKKAELSAQLDEINKRLQESYKQERFPGGYMSKTEFMVRERMNKQRNPLFNKILEIRNSSIFKVKMSGVAKDTKDVFDDLTKELEKLQKQVESLPEIKPLQIQ